MGLMYKITVPHHQQSARDPPPLFLNVIGLCIVYETHLKTCQP